MKDRTGRQPFGFDCMEVPGGVWQASQAKVLFLQKLVGHVSASST